MRYGKQALQDKNFMDYIRSVKTEGRALYGYSGELYEVTIKKVDKIQGKAAPVVEMDGYSSWVKDIIDPPKDAPKWFVIDINDKP